MRTILPLSESAATVIERDAITIATPKPSASASPSQPMMNRLRIASIR